MGVINMAHGELMMIGAYATYVVQNLFQRYLPGAFDWYLLVARARRRSSVCGAGRHGARAQRDPLPLRPAARDAARHLGHQPDADADGALDLRRAERRGREPELAVRRRRADERPACCPTTASPSSPSRCVVLGWRLAPARAARGSACSCAASRRTARWRRCIGVDTARVDMLDASGSAPASPASPAARCRRSATSGPTSARATSSTRSWWWCSAASASSPARSRGASASASLNKLLEPLAGAVLAKIVVLCSSSSSSRSGRRACSRSRAARAEA